MSSASQPDQPSQPVASSSEAYVRSGRHNYDYVPPGLTTLVPDCYVQDSNLFLEQARYWSTFISEVNKRSVYHARCISALAWHIEDYAFGFTVSTMLEARRREAALDQARLDPTIPPPARSERCGAPCPVSGCNRHGIDQRHVLSHFRRACFRCSVCRRPVATDAELSLHIEEHQQRARTLQHGKHKNRSRVVDGGVTCPICKCPFGSAERASRHLRRIHSDVPGTHVSFWRPQLIE